MKTRADPKHDNMHNNSTWWEEVLIFIGASLLLVIMLLFAGGMWAFERKRVYWTTAVLLILSLGWIW